MQQQWKMDSSPNSIVLDAPFIAEQGIGLKDWKPKIMVKNFMVHQR